MYEFMTGIKFLNFIADIFGVPEEKRQERIRKYADLFEMTENLAAADCFLLTWYEAKTCDYICVDS